MKRLHWMLLGMLPGPFLGWFGTLMFLLVMQFLIKYLPDLVGKGLPLGVILELISYNLAYMVVLAVPMATLIAMIMTFGRLAESNAYQVIKSAGISLPQLTWPLLIVGLLLTGGMMYFNNLILPEANHRARNLWIDIQRKKPGFQLQPGVFYDGIEGYSILVQHRDPETDSLRDVTIYDYRNSGEHVVLKAQQGLLQPIAGGRFIDLILEDGEFHRLRRLEGQERYERLAFGRYRLRLDLSDFVFTRSQEEGYRTDRTTPTRRCWRWSIRWRRRCNATGPAFVGFCCVCWATRCMQLLHLTCHQHHGPQPPRPASTHGRPSGVFRKVSGPGSTNWPCSRPGGLRPKSKTCSARSSGPNAGLTATASRSTRSFPLPSPA